MTAPLVDLRVVDPEMNEVPRDGKTAGEIVLRSPWLTQGYFDNPEGAEELWAGGYLHTSDIAVLTPDGYVQITDRIKDVIKTGGEWVSSLQIEDLITQCSGVAEAAVIGVSARSTRRSSVRNTATRSYSRWGRRLPRKAGRRHA
jgi:fatty-acyl-CoA synthase